MFWEILFIVLGVLLLGTIIFLSIPFSLRARIDRLDHVEWSVWYGPVNLAPSGYKRVLHFYRNRVEPVVEWIKRKRRPEPPEAADEDEYRYEPRDEVPPAIPPRESEGHLDIPEEKPTPLEVKEEAPPVDEQPFAPDEPAEQGPSPYDPFSEEEDRPPDPWDFNEYDLGDDEFDTKPGAGEKGNLRLKEIKRRIQNLLDKLNKGRLYLEQYGPFGKKVIRRLLKMAKNYWMALRWKKLYVRIATGGDPASLGATQGWLYAIDGALEGRLNGHIIFEPDFQTHTFEPEAEAAVDLRIHLILFVPPTVEFLVRFPWIGLLRTVQQIRKEQG